MNGAAWHGGRLDPKNDYKNLPKFVTVHSSEDVSLSGVSFINGTNWNIHIVYSTRCSVDGVRIVTPFKGTDGIDVDSSTHVIVENVIVSNGDDCVAVKSGFDCFGIAMHRPSSDILIRCCLCCLCCQCCQCCPCCLRCLCYCAARAHTAHLSNVSCTRGGSIAVGSEMSGGVENVLITVL